MADADVDWGKLIPRLQRFYGGRPQDWLEAVPAKLVRAMVRMMPRIEAGETLSAINRAALTNGATHESDLGRMHAFEEVRRKAAGVPPPAPTKADPSDLAAMGIGVVNAEELPTVGDLKEWLGQSPSSSEAVGEQERG